MEVCHFLRILQMPIREDFSSSECCSLTTTGGIEEDPIEYFGFTSKVLARIEGHSYIQTSHTIEVLEELRNALTRGLIRDDKTLRIVFCELGGLASRTRCHIEDEK